MEYCFNTLCFILQQWKDLGVSVKVETWKRCESVGGSGGGAVREVRR